MISFAIVWWLQLNVQTTIVLMEVNVDWRHQVIWRVCVQLDILEAGVK